MRRWVAVLLACAMMLGAYAQAESVEERINHLLGHGKREVFTCSGRMVKLRVAPNANKMHGRAVLGDQFKLLDVFGEWVHVEMTDVHPGNHDARRGMTGWIHVDHIACECDVETAEMDAAEALEE